MVDLYSIYKGLGMLVGGCQEICCTVTSDVLFRDNSLLHGSPKKIVLTFQPIGKQEILVTHIHFNHFGTDKLHSVKFQIVDWSTLKVRSTIT